MPKNTKTLLAMGAILLGSFGMLALMRTTEDPSGKTQHTAQSITQDLETHGLSVDQVVESGGAFSAQKGATFHIGSELVTAFLYRTPAEAGTLARQFSPDAQTLGGTPMQWVAPPHLYYAGNAIVLYLGSSPPILEALKQIFGTQFAGV